MDQVIGNFILSKCYAHAFHAVLLLQCKEQLCSAKIAAKQQIEPSLALLLGHAAIDNPYDAYGFIRW